MAKTKRGRTGTITGDSSQEADKALLYQSYMSQHFRAATNLGRTRAASAEEFFGFGHRDVATLHHHKQGCGFGLWYRLHDGRVFSVKTTAFDNPDPAFYDATAH